MAEYVQVTDFERIAPLPEACATERPLPAGLPVEGLGIRFTVGSSNATRDGRSFRLAEPLWFLPEPEGLEALFRDARER